MTEARDPGPEAVDEILASLEDFKWPPTTVARQARRLRAHIEHLRGQLERERGRLDPPKHKFWGAGEKDCPLEIKAGNGELHTLRCKVCGTDDPRVVCRAATPSVSGLSHTGGDRG